MILGNPIVIREDPQQRQFLPLAPISVRREDPRSFDESLLQELIDAAPHVLPIREYLPSTVALFSLGREVPVNLGANKGFIDNLLVTNDGYLVIVETKLYRNPEGIREVIAQTLQYGMAVSQFSVTELESKIRLGMSPSLRAAESVRDCVFRQAEELGRLGALADDFEEAFERHLRRGEVLLLIVSDGIHVGVERVTHWLNEQGSSSPFRFGLVELRFHAHGDERVVVPRTVLKTREVSRHVVVVDVRQGVDVVAQVTDEFRSAGGGKVQESRPVKASGPAMTKAALLQLMSAEDLSIMRGVFDRLEAIGLDQSGTGQSLRFGFTFPAEGGTFVPMAYFGKGDVYLLPPIKVFRLLGDEAGRELRTQAAALGFLRQEQIDQPNAASSNVKYTQLGKTASQFVAFLDNMRNQLTMALVQEEAGSA